MKLYGSIKKRLAKKWIGNDYWYKMILARNLKVGDLIHTCNGYNERIAVIEPRIWREPYRKGYVIGDLDIETESGGSHSLQHCCDLPIFSKEQILSYWKYLAENNSDIGWNFGVQHQKLLKAVKNGEDPFDDFGCILPKYRYTPGDYQEWIKKYDEEILKEESN